MLCDYCNKSIGKICPNRKMDDYYSKIASGYDELHGQEQDEKLQELLDHVELRHNLTLLDVGCGTGRSAAQLELAGVHWHGIEPSPGLIAQAPPHVRLRIKQAAAESIPYPEASFDIIISLTAMQNFADPEQGVREMIRVAKPEALFLVSFLKKSQKKELLDRLLRQHLRIEESWEQSKDLMYIASKPI
jgi:ubiquinone/menaquinone biosynthesis C-methylase UbiE